MNTGIIEEKLVTYYNRHFANLSEEKQAEFIHRLKKDLLLQLDPVEGCTYYIKFLRKNSETYCLISAYIEVGTAEVGEYVYCDPATLTPSPEKNKYFAHWGEDDYVFEKTGYQNILKRTS